MKLDDLRARLRAGVRSKPKPKPAAKKWKQRLRCSKCRKPREPAKLTDPDVVEILNKGKKRERERVLGAYRCRACRIIWIVSKMPPTTPAPPMHHPCRSSVKKL